MAKPWAQIVHKPSWCANDPLVTVPQGETSKPITLIYPYYFNPVFFTGQFDHWSLEASRGHISVILVDDCSPYPASEAVKLGDGLTPWFRLFRIHQDVRWNWLAARNIGFHHAETDWCLVTDMDHVVPRETLESCIYGQHDPQVVYGFSRKEHTGEEIAPHPNSWFLTKQKFWEIGGYDESFSGYYGTDGEWRRRIRTKAPIHILTDYLVRHEYQQDSSTTHYQRKEAQDAAVSRIIKARKPGWKPKVLSFPYTEVQL
jgi:glycosyltransferase involved in cell wall biosynthesis